MPSNESENTKQLNELHKLRNSIRELSDLIENSSKLKDYEEHIDGIVGEENSAKKNSLRNETIVKVQELYLELSSYYEQDNTAENKEANFMSRLKNLSYFKSFKIIELLVHCKEILSTIELKINKAEADLSSKDCNISAQISTIRTQISTIRTFIKNLVNLYKNIQNHFDEIKEEKCISLLKEYCNEFQKSSVQKSSEITDLEVVDQTQRLGGKKERYKHRDFVRDCILSLPIDKFISLFIIDSNFFRLLFCHSKELSTEFGDIPLVLQILTDNVSLVCNKKKGRAFGILDIHGQSVLRAFKKYTVFENIFENYEKYNSKIFEEIKEILLGKISEETLDDSPNDYAAILEKILKHIEDFGDQFHYLMCWAENIEHIYEFRSRSRFFRLMYAHEMAMYEYEMAMRDIRVRMTAASEDIEISRRAQGSGNILHMRAAASRTDVTINGTASLRRDAADAARSLRLPFQEGMLSEIEKKLDEFAGLCKTLKDMLIATGVECANETRSDYNSDEDKRNYAMQAIKIDGFLKKGFCQIIHSLFNYFNFCGICCLIRYEKNSSEKSVTGVQFLEHSISRSFFFYNCRIDTTRNKIHSILNNCSRDNAFKTQASAYLYGIDTDQSCCPQMLEGFLPKPRDNRETNSECRVRLYQQHCDQPKQQRAEVALKISLFLILSFVTFGFLPVVMISIYFIDHYEGEDNAYHYSNEKNKFYRILLCVVNESLSNVFYLFPQDKRECEQLERQSSNVVRALKISLFFALSFVTFGFVPIVMIIMFVARKETQEVILDANSETKREKSRVEEVDRSTAIQTQQESASEDLLPFESAFQPQTTSNFMTAELTLLSQQLENAVAANRMVRTSQVRDVQIRDVQIRDVSRQADDVPTTLRVQETIDQRFTQIVTQIVTQIATQERITQEGI